MEPSSPNAALAEAARAVASRKLGRLRVPVAVTVHLDEQFECERVIVELIGVGNADESPIGECLRDVIVLLARANHRLTTTQIFAGLEAQETPHGDGPLRATLAGAVRDGLLTSRPKSKPPGYGLPGWS